MRCGLTPGAPRLVALGAVLFFALVTARLAGVDAVTYYAAGERLNAGHALYALSPGDRALAVAPPYWTAPLLSPPLIAVMFRPLALIPIEAATLLFVAIQAVGIFLLTWFLVRTTAGAILAIALALPLGLAMVIGNVNGLLLLGYVAVWRYRTRPWIGGLVAMMGAVKLLPFVLFGFLVAQRDVRHLLWFAIGCAGCLAVGVAGAGWDAHVAYVNVLTTSLPQPLSLPDLTGIRWLSAPLLAAATVVAALLPARRAFRMSLVALVIAAPSVGLAITGQLLALLAPETEGDEVSDVDLTHGSAPDVRVASQQRP
jgi:hypothetical protein